MENCLLILGLSIGFAIGKDCWTTGCQPNHWDTTGCEQYGRVEKSREVCRDSQGAEGNKYTCCEGTPGQPTTPPPPPPPTSGKGFVTFDQFSKAVTSNAFPTPSHEQYNNFNNNARNQGRIGSIEEAAMCLAQLIHESDGLRAKREYACEHSNCQDSYRDPGCDAPGQYYYGRGYIQLTWCGNYKGASRGIFGDDRLVNYSDSVARDDSIAWRTAFWYWSTRVHDKSGVTQGQFGASTKAINGAIECSGQGHPTPPKRFRIYGNVRAAFGLSGPGNAAGCA